MYICVCNGVTEREIRSSIEAGARSLDDLQRELGVASGCGQCKQEAKCLLREVRRECLFASTLQAA
ncbi:MAG: (2Fe-2S)-binding protein [Burkholderiales bacterium]|nr:(2Fe-2S)-binding protein [Burkholderiales bacterium]